MKLTPAMTAAVTFVATAATLFAARGDDSNLLVMTVPALLTGTLAGVFHAKKLGALLACALGGLILGIINAVDIIRYDVPDKFGITVATLATFLALGLMLGAFVEFVRWLHQMAHGHGMRGKPPQAP
ncbi:MAG: hypothetical protein RLZZ324_154 [Candidatus Parcubacteria bacterium]|jgi:hypothetical protein